MIGAGTGDTCFLPKGAFERGEWAGIGSPRELPVDWVAFALFARSDCSGLSPGLVETPLPPTVQMTNVEESVDFLVVSPMIVSGLVGFVS